MRPRPLLLLAGLSILAAAGPALAQPASPDDPFESTNRRLFAGHSDLDKGFFRPVGRLYQALTPGPIGVAIHNVLTNLSEPVIIANDVLQLRLKRAARDTLRLTANTTAGWLGIMDVATPGGLPHQDNDFGVTLGRCGVGPGPYLFIPFVGPSTVRDAIGVGADVAMSPFSYLNFSNRTTINISLLVVGGLDTRVTTQAQEDALLADAADPYATLRSVYLQNREAMIRGESAFPNLPPLDEPPSPPPGDQAAPASGETPPATTSPSASAPPSPIRAAAADVADPDAPIATARDYAAKVASAFAPAPAA